MKEELGLDHFEGRSWQGLHRHALMTMIAYAFLQHRRLAHAGRKKESTDLRLSQPCPPCVTPSSISVLRPPPQHVHTAENKSLKKTGENGFCQSSASFQCELLSLARFMVLFGDRERLVMISESGLREG